MARKVRSLSDQMAELSNVAPGDADMDPESDVDGYDAVERDGVDDSEEDLEEEARSHARHNYVDVAPSKMRKQANFMEGVDGNELEKYAGIKATRSEMMGGDSDESEGDQEGEESLSEDDGDEDEDDDEIEEETGGEEEDSVTFPVKKPRVRFESSNGEASEVVNGNSLTAAQSDAQLLQEMRIRSREDAEKGRDARKQMDAWGKLLGIRIRGQKVIRGAGRIPSTMINKCLDDLSISDRQAYDSTLESLDEMSSRLFTLQRQVLHSFTTKDSLESNVISSSLSRLENQLEIVTTQTKRSHDEMENGDDSHLDTLLQLDQNVFEPLWRDVLTRWSSRTSISNLDDGQKNKFESSLKAMNQSAENQIDRGLTGDAFERLRKRTRVWRGSEKESRIAADDLQGQEDDDDVEDEERQDIGLADVFDDSDFYAAMLRELIDSRGATSSVMGVEGSESSLAWAQAAKRASKKNKNGDMRASKGRKLRFDIIEKVENFMPPIPRETWSKDQIDRLFNQLRGGDAQTVEETTKTGNGKIDEKDDRVDLAGLRLFG